MPLYLLQVAYTPEAWGTLIKKPRAMRTTKRAGYRPPK
jgi:hypothetical protein